VYCRRAIFWGPIQLQYLRVARLSCDVIYCAFSNWFRSPSQISTSWFSVESETYERAAGGIAPGSVSVLDAGAGLEDWLPAWTWGLLVAQKASPKKLDRGVERRFTIVCPVLRNSPIFQNISFLIAEVDVATQFPVVPRNGPYVVSSVPQKCGERLLDPASDIPATWKSKLVVFLRLSWTLTMVARRVAKHEFVRKRKVTWGRSCPLRPRILGVPLLGISSNNRHGD